MLFPLPLWGRVRVGALRFSKLAAQAITQAPNPRLPPKGEGAKAAKPA